MSLPSSEEWRPVPGHEDQYEVSNQGRVRRIGGALLNGYIDSKGYTRLQFWRDGIATRAGLHRIVLTAFDRPAQPGEISRHLDGDPSNNRLENLAWGSCAENVEDTFRHGRHPSQGRTHCDRGHDLAETGIHRVLKSGPNAGQKRIECRACRSIRWTRRVSCPRCDRDLAKSSLAYHLRVTCTGEKPTRARRNWPPFNPDATCPKCMETRILSHWRAAGSIWSGALLREREEGDWVTRCCQRCQFEWAEEPSDRLSEEAS